MLFREPVDQLMHVKMFNVYVEDLLFLLMIRFACNQAPFEDLI